MGDDFVKIVCSQKIAQQFFGNVGMGLVKGGKFAKECLENRTVVPLVLFVNSCPPAFPFLQFVKLVKKRIYFVLVCL